jgi:hypothetical protein
LNRHSHDIGQRDEKGTSLFDEMIYGKQQFETSSIKKAPDQE